MRFPWKGAAASAGVLGLAFLIAKCDSERPPAYVPPPPPPPPVVVNSAIAIVYSTRGDFFGAAGPSYFIADRNATMQCEARLPSDHQCFGVVGMDIHDGPTPNTCVGIGVDFLLNVRGDAVYTSGKLSDYQIVRAPTRAGAQAALDAAQPGRPQHFAFGTAIFCNY
jgi:hypothetical protein